jgi:DHA1 family inner membrane transport protein
MKPSWPIMALAVGAFGIGATEFSPMGLLPLIAAGLDVSIPTAGLLVSAYALGVMAGAPLMTLALARWSPRSALIALMGIFTVGNLMAVLAPGYGALMLARLVTSLAHGAFFGLGSVAAARLAPPGKSAGAVSGMFMGLALANIGGVPAANWIGQQVGWRAAFAGIAGLGVIAVVTLAVALPTVGQSEPPDVRRELGVLVRPGVLLALATTVAGSAAMFSLYTYVAPILTYVSAAAPAFTSVALVLIGVGFTLGNALGGRLSDRRLGVGVAVFLFVVIATDLLFPLIGRTLLGAGFSLLIWGAASFAIVPPLQALVMRAAADAPGLAAAVNIGAFNLGNALGAGLGGAVIAAGFGYPSVPASGAAMAGLSMGLVLRVVRRSGRSTRMPCLESGSP